MMDLIRRRATIFIEYAFFMMVAGTLRIMPIVAGVWVGTVIARLFCLLSGRSTKYIKSQMQECFGERYTDKEYDRLVGKFYLHFGTLLAEAVRVKILNMDNVDEIVDWGDLKELNDELSAKYNRGVLFATGHIGNWEFTGSAGAMKGILAGSIARPLDNPLIDRKVKEVREYSGQEIWDKEGAILKLIKAIKRRKSVGILIDQDAGEQGLRVPFLGRAASTNTAVSELAIRLGAPIVPSAIVRVGNKPLRFKVVHGEPIFPDNKDNSQEAVYTITEKVNNELSRIISDNPEQWLWIHRRWKTPNPSDRRRYKRYE